jgi:hypothetical protein
MHSVMQLEFGSGALFDKTLHTQPSCLLFQHSYTYFTNYKPMDSVQIWNYITFLQYKFLFVYDTLFTLGKKVAFGRLHP